MERLRSSEPALVGLAEPWALLGGAAASGVATDTLQAGLGPLAAAPVGCSVRIAGCLEALPAHGPPVEAGVLGTAWQVYDLPASELRGEEPLRLRIGSEGYTIRLGGQVPRPAGKSREGDAGDPSARLEAFIDSLVGIMLELRAQAEEFAGRGGVACGAGAGSSLPMEPEAFEAAGRLPLARLPWQRAAELLLAPASEPRMDVIVQIALHYRDALERLAQSPRRTLRRQRRMTAIGRVQQLDSACLEWFVRQPGRTATEKAGAAQELLALVRTEDYDTLENRVLKDFLRRAIDASNLYLREHRGRFDQSTRYRAVAALADTCRRLLRDTPLVSVRSLPGFPQPNYVLLHDAAYRELWQWYGKLVRRRQVTDNAWQWQRRLWADFVRLRVACELITAHRVRNGFAARMPMAHDLWIRQEQDAGAWLHPLDWPGPVWLDLGVPPAVAAQIVHPAAVRQNQCVAGLPVASWLGKTGADLAIVFLAESPLQGQRHVCLFLWAIHCGADGWDSPAVHSQACRALKALRRMAGAAPNACTFRGLILRSHLGGGVNDLPGFAQAGIEVLHCCVPADPTAWHAAEGILDLRYALYECAALAAKGE